MRINHCTIMGVINVTPDSFSDGGQFLSVDKAVKHALELINQGAEIVDIGGESSRPGADFVSLQQEINRVVPVIQAIRQHNPDVTLSIDTSKPEVMQAAIQAGANFINDINALQNQGCVELVAQANLPVCLMHKQGQPKFMQENPQYTDVLTEVMDFFASRIADALATGIKRENIILDPGIGFGKTLAHNLTLLNNIKTLKSLGYPLMLGVSRKSMFAEILGAPVEDRLYGSLAVAQYAFRQGVEFIRVHDVKATADVIKVSQLLIE